MDENKADVIDIIVQKERIAETYTRYLYFERKRELKKVPLGLFLLFLSMILVGIMINIQIVWILGIISTSLIVIVLIVYLIRFQIFTLKFKNGLNNRLITAPSNFQFSFDHDSIKYTSDTLKTEMKWSMIENYVVNKEDIYLFLANRELLDIISEENLGKNTFERFVSILKEKVIEFK